MRKYETISIDLKKRIENGEFEETKKTAYWWAADERI